MYIYLIPDTKYQEKNKCIFSTCSFSFIFHQIFLKYSEYSRQIWFVQRKIMTRRMYIYLIPDTKNLGYPLNVGHSVNAILVNLA